MGNPGLTRQSLAFVLQQAQQSAETAEAAADTKTVAINAADAEYDQMIAAYPLTERIRSLATHC